MIAPRPFRVHPKPVRRLRKMTIAAGYVCDSGIVICADTQETIPGYTKNSTHKLMSFQTADLNLVFAGSGNNATQIDEATQEIAVKMSVNRPKGENEFRKSLREVLEELFPKAHYPRGGGTEVEILMAVKGNGMEQLYKISDCNVAPVRERAAVGSGVVLALQLLERHYDPSVQINEAAIICIYALHHVKKWVDGCGGNTELIVIPRFGQVTSMPSSQIQEIEKYCEAYDDAVKNLLIQIPRTPHSLELFDAYILEAKNKLALARLSFQEFEQSMREFAAHMGIPYEDMMRDANESLAKIGIKPSTSHNSEDQP